MRILCIIILYQGQVPLAVVPGEGLQRDVVLRDGHCEVVRVEHREVAEELLDLEHRFPEVHLCQVLQAQVLYPVGEDCAGKRASHL